MDAAIGTGLQPGGAGTRLRSRFNHLSWLAPAKPLKRFSGATGAHTRLKPGGNGKTTSCKKFDMFDKVNGTDATRRALQVGRPAKEIVASWQPGEAKFRQERKKFLLY